LNLQFSITTYHFSRKAWGEGTERRDGGERHVRTNIWQLQEQYVHTQYIVRVTMRAPRSHQTHRAEAKKREEIIRRERGQNAVKNHTIKIGNKYFEIVEQFKYLGKTLTNKNSILKEIQGRLQSGIASYHSVQNLLFSRYFFFFYFWHNNPPVGQGLLIHEVSRTHIQTHHTR
jgi:hypothetical protein